MQLFVRDKKFYQTLIRIALPIATQNLINFGVSMADTVMLGMMGEIELSAAAIANQLGFIFMLLTFGMGSGSNVMIAQYWGSGDTKPIHKIITVMYRILLVAALVFTGIAVFLPRQVMSIFTTDLAVIEAGAEFLRIVGLSYLLTGITTTTVFVLRAVASVKIALAVSLSSLVSNITLNYILIFGKLGLPALGVRGAAIATCLARVVELTILLVYMIKFEKKICYKLSYFFAKKLNIFKDYIKTAVPVIINELLWGGGTAMVSVVIGRMGTQFVAANSICSVIHQFVTIAIFGMGNAAAVIVGNTVGAGEYQKIPAYAKTFISLSVCMGVLSSAVVLLVKNPIINLYNISDQAKIYAGQIINVYAVLVVFMSFAMVSLIGVLRGGGDTRFVLFADVVFLWCISIPLGFITGLGLGWPVPVVYLVIKSDELLKCIAASLRLRKSNWINDVTKNTTN